MIEPIIRNVAEHKTEAGLTLFEFETKGNYSCEIELCFSIGQDCTLHKQTKLFLPGLIKGQYKIDHPTRDISYVPPPMYRYPKIRDGKLVDIEPNIPYLFAADFPPARYNFHLSAINFGPIEGIR